MPDEKTRKPSVGQELYITGGLRRSRSTSDIRPCIVRKIGRQYFYVADPPTAGEKNYIRFNLSDWSFDGDSNWSYRLYESQEQYEYEQDRSKKREAVERFFREWGNVKHVPDADLDTIYRILVKDGLVDP